MCLAIYKPEATAPDKAAYRNGFDGNAHGAGFAACHEGGLVVAKGFFKFDKFWKAFEPYAACPAIIHFRWATHGKRDEGNCHPFIVADDLAVIHNGVLDISTADDKTKSDTWHFVEKVLKPMRETDRGFYDVPHLRYLGERATAGSKLVFLRADGDVAIWNEDAGIWAEDGHWYSNDGFRAAKQRWPWPSPKSTPASEKAWGYEDDEPLWDSGRGVSSNFRWSADVPWEDEDVADELLSWGFSINDIELGFREDPAAMRQLVEDNLAEA